MTQQMMPGNPHEFSTLEREERHCSRSKAVVCRRRLNVLVHADLARAKRQQARIDRPGVATTQFKAAYIEVIVAAETHARTVDEALSSENESCRSESGGV